VEIFEGRLSRLRDGRKRSSQLRQPVREARELNRYLLVDGLDATALTKDISMLTARPDTFRWGFPEYQEASDPDQRIQGPPEELLLTMQKNLRSRENLRSRAKRLATDTKATVVNLLASAELQQAVANTRMQRTVIAVTIAALMLSLVSLWVNPEVQHAVATWIRTMSAVHR